VNVDLKVTPLLAGGDVLAGVEEEDKVVATAMVVVLELFVVTAAIVVLELIAATVLIVVLELALELMPSTSRHCEYQGFCSTQVQPAVHVVPPVQLIPPPKSVSVGC
jgi:hypothetical protein